MSHDPAAPLRGLAAGSMTAALTVAAHGLAAGTAPSGSAVMQLGVLAATIGALAATLTEARRLPVVLGLLSAGQVIGHLLLAAAGHQHGVAAPPTMVGAHLIALAVGAILISRGDQMCSALSRVVRRVTRAPMRPIPSAPGTRLRRVDQPLRSSLLLTASVSHRGPPVRSAR